MDTHTHIHTQVPRTISIDFFLLIFDADQRAVPGQPGVILKDAPAPPPVLSRVASAISRIPSNASNKNDVFERVCSGIYIHIYLNTYVYTYIHTYIHTHTYIRMIHTVKCL